MSGKEHQKPLGVLEGSVYEFAGPHRGEGVAESQQEDLEMPYKKTGRTLGEDVHLVNRKYADRAAAVTAWPQDQIRDIQDQAWAEAAGGRGRGPSL